MNSKLIYGIQQVGVGVKDAQEAFNWYASKLGADALIFDDSNTATYMAKYMGGEPRNKRAILAVNMQGGGGYELWQYLDRTPTGPERPVQLGDLGINLIKIKTRDLPKCFQNFQQREIECLSEIVTDPDGQSSFYFQDPYGNILQVKEFNSWHANKKLQTGGIFACTIGVSDIEQSKKLYQDILGYDTVIYDRTGQFEDLQGLPGGRHNFRRVLLGHSKERKGGFSPIWGDSQMELIQVLDREPVKIFEDRYWGDLGYIHLCFDIKNMDALVQECKDRGFPFQVLSNPSFDMGDTSAHWGYIEDPDGTLIEFVETHRVPVIKKLNWYINLRKRKPTKPLPTWLTNAISFNRVKVKK